MMQYLVPQEWILHERENNLPSTLSEWRKNILLDISIVS